MLPLSSQSTRPRLVPPKLVVVLLVTCNADLVRSTPGFEFASTAGIAVGSWPKSGTDSSSRNRLSSDLTFDLRCQACHSHLQPFWKGMAPQSGNVEHRTRIRGTCG